MTESIKVSLLIDDGDSMPAWIDLAIRELLACEGLEIVDCIFLAPNDTRATESGFLQRILQKAEDVLLGGSVSARDALEVVSAQPTRQFIEHSLSSMVRETDEVTLELFNTDDASVLINLSRAGVPASVRSRFCCGVLNYAFGADYVNWRGSPGRTEVLLRDPVTHSYLVQRFSAGKVDKILYESVSCTAQMSVRDNRNHCLWKAPYFVPRVVQYMQDGHLPNCRLRSTDGEQTERSCEQASPRQSPIRGTRLGIALAAKFFQKARMKIADELFERQWILGVRTSTEIPSTLKNFETVEPPADRFWADPFVFEHKGEEVLFFEELQYSKNRGEIVAAKIIGGKLEEPVKVVLRCDYHLSYPFMFRHDDSVYMIPESYDNASVDLFRCTKFPFEWTFDRNLMDGFRLADATLLQHEGRWWMFANGSFTDEISPWDELYLFHSDSPISTNWTPHSLNPVISDVRTSRPAGAILKRSGRLIRPSQNSSGHYGYGLNFREIVRLDPQNYEERELESLTPDDVHGMIASHSFAQAAEFQFVDFQRWKLKTFAKKFR